MREGERCQVVVQGQGAGSGSRLRP
jgi:hypothetical protein